MICEVLGVAEVKQDNLIFSDKNFPFLFSLSKVQHDGESRWHESIEIKYVISGTVTVMIDTEMVCAGEGDIIFVNPHEVHSNITVSDDTGMYHLMMMGLDFFSNYEPKELDLCRLLLEKRVRFNNLIKNPRAARILRDIADEMKNEDKYSKLAARGMFQEFFAVLLRSEVRENSENIVLGDRIKFYKAVEPAVIKLRDSYNESFCGEELAKLCKMNRYHFCRVFKRATGMTVIQYQNECRLRMAEILFVNSECSISEISRMVGFEDEAYFSRLYKKTRGVSPKTAKSKLSK